MRFGVILPIQSKDAGLDVLWEELREEVAVAEEAGFDAVFMTEFHQARGGAFVSPLLLGAGLLQGTTRIRFGTEVCVRAGAQAAACAALPDQSIDWNVAVPSLPNPVISPSTSTGTGASE